MSRRRASFAAAVAALSALAVAGPAAADVLSGVKRDLKTIEDRLRAGEWDSARKACNDAMKDLIDNDAHGAGSLPVYGLVIAFRAVAEAGRGDLAAAVWDWTSAEQLSPAATGFDLARFDGAGATLRNAVAQLPEEFELPGPIKLVGEAGQPRIPRTPVYRGQGFECAVQSTVIIDAEGRPIRVKELGGACVTLHTGLAVLTLEKVRGWRFEPVQREGRNVTVRYGITTTFRQNLDDLHDR